MAKNTAHGITHTGPSLAKGDHLQPANEPIPPSQMQRSEDRGWRYTKADDTDIRRTWARFGWSPLPVMRGAR